jgi:peptidoglycan/xylan/chitin deacetylase (PgdA/CDA1 family)
LLLKSGFVDANFSLRKPENVIKYHENKVYLCREEYMRKALLVFLLFLVLLPVVSADNLTLCYHKFEYSTFDLYDVMPEVFDWQLNYIKFKKLDIIHLQQVTDFYDKGKGNIDKTALITIDDGWKSEMNILPVLQKYKAPAAFFIYKLVLNRSVHYMTYADLDVLKATGLADFGCHSYTHIPMIKKDAKTLKREITDAKTADGNVLKMTLDTYAYPYGMFDAATKGKVSENFKIAFGVNDGWNKAGTDKYNLNRFVVYKSTGFGEFMSYVNYAAGEKDRGYAVHFLGTGRDEEGHYNKIKFRVYKFPEESLPKTALIIPSSGAGPAWAFKLIKALNAAGFECHLVSSRNNYVPFYRPDKVMTVVKDWGVDEAINDLKEVIDYKGFKNRKPVVFAWGDGFDSFMALLGAKPEYAAKVSGVIAVNPSLDSGDTDLEYYKQEIDKYEAMLASEKYEASSLEFFLKIKTFMDLMVINPDGPSPFAKPFGYPGDTNKMLLAKFLESEHQPELGFNLKKIDSLIKDFREACMQPAPLLSMVVPVAYMLDLNKLWYNDFYMKELGVEHAHDVKLPASFFYSKPYAKNEAAVKAAMSSLVIGGEYPWDDESTVEILLDEGFIEKALAEAVTMHGSGKVQPAASPAASPTTSQAGQ